MKKPKRLNIIWLESKGNVMAYGAKSGHTIMINKTGTYIWQLCNGEQTVEEIINKVSQKFHTNPKICRDDVLRFLDELRRNGMIYDCQQK